MRDIVNLPSNLADSRQLAELTQAEVAARMGTTQSAVARLERGEGNPTVATLQRYADAIGMRLRVELTPAPLDDPVVELYKRDVDRSLLRENLRTTVDERIRSLGEWQHATQALREATRRAKVST